MIESYYKTVDNDWFKQRLIGLMLAMTAAFVILLVRLFYLQIIAGEEFRRLSTHQRIRLQSIDPARGLIFDRNRELLVDNRPAFDLSIVLKDAVDLDGTLKRLSDIVKVPVEEFHKKIARKKGMPSYKPILLKQDIGRDTLAVIEVDKFDLPGVVVDVKPRRHYLNKKSAAHLIGYLSEISPDELKSGEYPNSRAGDYIGKFGVEKAYEQYLKGTRGGRQVEVNATGQVVRVLKTVDAKPGHNIFLTIDQKLQQRAESLLEGVAGAAVAMDPNNGHILAMCSSPSFDLNTFVGGLSKENWDDLISNPFRPMENKCIQGEYPPASTYKIVTALAGLEEGVIDESTIIKCYGQYRYGDRIFRCWKRGGHGQMDVVKALTESCDVFFYQVGQKLSVDRLAWYAKACGLGALTGINLDHEANGLIPTAAWKKNRTGIPWQRGETLSVAIGQGYDLVTPLQMLSLIAAIGNGGTRYRPIILDSIETADGETIFTSKKEMIGQIPAKKQKTYEIIRKGLWSVINSAHGTARIAKIDGIDCAGKTGTAQVVGRKPNDIALKDKAVFLKPHAWFVAYAPAEKPTIAVSVMVEHGEHGSSTCAPIAREMIRTYLDNEP